jgi:hypothetical protein
MANHRFRPYIFPAMTDRYIFFYNCSIFASSGGKKRTEILITQSLRISVKMSNKSYDISMPTVRNASSVLNFDSTSLI